MSTGITVEGLAEFEATAHAAAGQLGELEDAHRAAGELLVRQPQPRTPAVAADVRYDVNGGATLLSGDVIYDGDGSGAPLLNPSTTAEIVGIFADEIAAVVSTIHGT